MLDMSEEECEGCRQPWVFCECRWNDIPEPFTSWQQLAWLLVLATLSIILFVTVL